MKNFVFAIGNNLCYTRQDKTLECSRYLVCYQLVLDGYMRCKIWKGDTVMRKFSGVVLALGLLAVVIYLGSCIGGGLMDPTDPILPSPELEEGVADPSTRAITITKDNISVTLEHWSRTRLNRKYTTVDMRSPFYFLETWEQTFQTEVFHVTIKNDSPRSVMLNFKEVTLTDEREYVFKLVEDDFYRYKFLTKKMMDLKTKNGMEVLPQIMLENALDKGNTVQAGETRSGFIAFTAPSSQAEKLWVRLVLEKEPEVATAAYEPVEYKFDYIQDLVLRAKQPAIKR